MLYYYDILLYSTQADALPPRPARDMSSPLLSSPRLSSPLLSSPLIENSGTIEMSVYFTDTGI